MRKSHLTPEAGEMFTQAESLLLVQEVVSRAVCIECVDDSPWAASFDVWYTMPQVLDGVTEP